MFCDTLCVANIGLLVAGIQCEWWLDDQGMNVSPIPSLEDLLCCPFLSRRRYSSVCSCHLHWDPEWPHFLGWFPYPVASSPYEWWSTPFLGVRLEYSSIRQFCNQAEKPLEEDFWNLTLYRSVKSAWGNTTGSLSEPWDWTPGLLEGRRGSDTQLSRRVLAKKITH